MVCLHIRAGKFSRLTDEHATIAHDRPVPPRGKRNRNKEVSLARTLASSQSFPVQEEVWAKLVPPSILPHSRFALPTTPTTPVYFIANAFGGEPTPPGTFSGAEVRKKS